MTAVEAPDTHRVVLESVGKAPLATVGAIAKGMGTSPERVAQQVYRAPVVLVDALAPDSARGVLQLLTKLGFEARTEANPAPPLPIQPLFDVALHLSDASRAEEVAEALGAFVGVEPAAAMELMTRPPGVVLGGVSMATVQALQQRLPTEGLDLVAVDRDRATYELFATDRVDPRVLERVKQELESKGRWVSGPADGNGGWLGRGLPAGEAIELWRRHGTSGGLCLVPACLLRYDLNLYGGQPTEAACAALKKWTDMPADVAPKILAAGTRCLREGQRLEDLAEPMTELAALGLDVRADLVTFQRLTVLVDDALDDVLERAVGEIFAKVGVDRPARGCVSAPVWELTALRLRAACEKIGVEVHLDEVRS